MGNTPTVAEIAAALRTPGQHLLAPYRKPGASYAKLSPAKLNALEAAIDAALTQAAATEREACLAAVLNEHLCEPDGEEDAAYDRGVQDAAEAIIARRGE